jgi:hypothetical protein
MSLARAVLYYPQVYFIRSSAPSVPLHFGSALQVSFVLLSDHARSLQLSITTTAVVMTFSLTSGWLRVKGQMPWILVYMTQYLECSFSFIVYA